MKRDFTLLFSIGILNLILFFGIFKLFQNDTIYHNTLGVVSQNYERTGDWSNYEINQVPRPYTQLTNEKLLVWDAAIYNCISERMYIVEDDCYGQVRSAFFPLFPLVWKLTNLSALGISILNYLIFIFSIALLVICLLPKIVRDRMIIFSVLITLPSTIIYYLPYTEAFFLLTMTIATIGLLKEKYWLYFLGFLLMAMVRPATFFVLMAILTVESILFIRNKQAARFFKNSIFKALPFAIGYFASFLIQYLYSGSWTSFIDAQKHWAGGLQKITAISDWSVEGFGMSTFSLFFITIPALLFLGFMLITIKSSRISFLQKVGTSKMDYLFLVSIIYLAGIFVFTLLTSGGSLHSFFRFTLASPLFYIAMLRGIRHLSKIGAKGFVLIFLVISAFLFLFLKLTEYGGDEFRFPLMGLYLLLLSFLYMGLRKSLPKAFGVLALSIIVLANVVWNTYLFNMFLSNAWIFT